MQAIKEQTENMRNRGTRQRSHALHNSWQLAQFSRTLSLIHAWNLHETKDAFTRNCPCKETWNFRNIFCVCFPSGNNYIYIQKRKQNAFYSIEIFKYLSIQKLKQNLYQDAIWKKYHIDNKLIYMYLCEYW